MSKQIARLTFLTVFLPIFASCVAVGPDYRRPDVITPTGWNSETNTQTPALADWWKKLNDPVLNQLIADAIADNTSVADARAKVRQARAELVSAGGNAFPSLNGTASYTRSDVTSSNISGKTALDFNTKWEIDLFGGNRRGIEAAYYHVESATERLRAALVTLIGDIAKNYAQLRGVQAKISIAQQNSVLQDRTVVLTRARLQAGQISQVDLLSAQTQAASTRSQIPELRISYAFYLNNLTVLTGNSAIVLATKLDIAKPVPDVPRKTPAGLPATLLFNRPDLRAAEREYAASTARIGQAEANLYPGISLSGNISTGGKNFGDLARLSTIGWSFGPSLSIPVFQGGKLNAAVDAAKAARDQSFIAYRKAVLTALSEVENASVALNQNRLRYDQLQKIASNSRKINQLTLEQFKVGSKSFVEVLNAQTALLNSETDLGQFHTDLVLNYITLQKALGGGWDGQIDAKSPEVIDGYTGPHIVIPAIPPSPANGTRLP
ncbi:efflux transporter outer membrane subunit [Ochrobactrum sp. GPK 3]|uniref:efflux transporter outer membrane subunit n=1 Tax=Brucella sp. 22210 TaxID=3453892 RepID=UPI0031385BC2